MATLANGGKGKAMGTAKAKDAVIPGYCYTWGNEVDCSKRMSFVCKKRIVPCHQPLETPGRYKQRKPKLYDMM